MREKTHTYRYWDDDGNIIEEERGTGKWIFEEEDKIAIVAEYLETGCPASQIIENTICPANRRYLTGWTSTDVR